MMLSIQACPTPCDGGGSTVFPALCTSHTNTPTLALSLVSPFTGVITVHIPPITQSSICIIAFFPPTANCKKAKRCHHSSVGRGLVLSAAPTRALCLLEKNISQFFWDGPDGSRRRPMVDRATLAQPHIHGGLNCPLVKHIDDSRRVALWTCALYSTEEWACALKKRVLDETGVNGTAFLHKHIPCTNHAHQIIAAFSKSKSKGSTAHGPACM